MEQTRSRPSRFASGCATICVATSLAACALPTVPPSAFLPNSVTLKASEFEKVALYRVPGFDPTRYSAQHLRPTLLLVPASRLGDLAKPLQEEILGVVDKEIALRFSSIVFGSTLNSKNGLIVRAALTDVQMPNRALNFFSTVMLMPISSGGASLELEVIDEESGLLMFAASCTERGSVFWQFKGAFSLLSHAKHAISECIQRIDTAYTRGQS